VSDYLAHCCACGLEHACVPTAERDAHEAVWAAELEARTAERDAARAALRACMENICDPHRSRRMGLGLKEALVLDQGCAALGVTALDFHKALPEEKP
jgi:hypothetical protein